MTIVAGMPMTYDQSEYEMAGAVRAAPARSTGFRTAPTRSSSTSVSACRGPRSTIWSVRAPAFRC
ncbi:hypothetical protein AB0D57_43115 [Streptomyces sp. NPDC048275]|uniref:hypothetical protein n=1 Tax=Streptomyces sp. NPDC048275 TaxID=3155629 RepID=UPI0033ED52E2